ncbi:phosphoserine phosphatase serb [Ascodesmis nigricans]|uniref:phosphoserine phosphatase n=1 Tax=Ascodesmis nigricans TaxID=341454 RepID=A0A4S2N4M3_9PEZI|nr:phosphoserine phosphatase serb [Ascodesmis nigricans]
MSAPQRPGYTRRATSSNFIPDLKSLQHPNGASSNGEETITTAEGKSVKIKNSNQNFSLTSDTSTYIPSSSTLNLIATLSYLPSNATPHPSTNGATQHDRLDLLYGAGISDMTIYSFTNLLKSLTIPYRPSQSFHRRLSPTIVEITTSLPESLSIPDLRRHELLHDFETAWNVVITLQPNTTSRRYPRLVVFDMDSTLIQHETIDELAKFVGVEDKVKGITERAMRGELDFTASLNERCSLLTGVPSGVWDELKKVVIFTEGARELTRALKRLGVKMAVVSGGFVPLAEWVKEQLGLDYAYANQLVVSDDGTQLTGALTGPIINAEAKASLLQTLAAKHNVPLAHTLAVGDGANDLLMMAKAGLGVAFMAKPKVQEEAPARINTGTLLDILYLLGLEEAEVEELSRE